ncbi:zinc finger translocation-associated protein-like [Osmerus mordax]|uniref:zinc finger translocation-associated protein-like n=1 Tax=Osmerus mordax TaxID=8014 RepID=UPI003510C638
MEEKETGESEPVDLQCAEQTDSLVSLIISGEEEATQELSDLGHYEDRLTNGHVEEDGEGGTVTAICSPGTTYWSVSESSDSPFLLSPVPGPSQRRPRVKQASRPGLSRIPGRDHRRYYHEYWRSEYLMDFDPRRHGMICMVCGSSLATLKLSTIKRHIRQKHPDSLLWSAADKEVIRSGWESHLSLEGGQRTLCAPGGASDALGPLQETLDCARNSTGKPDGVTPKIQPRSPTPSPPPPSVSADPQGPSGPSAQTLERYLNDSLHAWFRQEFLMEYQAEAGRLVCMVCGRPLPSLHLDHIKSHVLDTHPNSLVFSSEEKHCILQTWALTHESDPLRDFIKSENTKEESETGGDFFPPDMETIQIGSDVYPDPEEGDGGPALDLGGEGGGVSAPEQGTHLLRQPRKRRLRGGYPWRLRLDYLVAYGPQGRGTFCMVCSQALPVAKVSSFRRHIQDCHPETTTLSRQEREAMAEAWTKDPAAEDQAMPMKEEISPSNSLSMSGVSETGQQTLTGDNNNNRTPTKMATVKKEEGVTGAKCATTPPFGRHGHYPGKDQRRNYQVRWRVEYLMDYDCRRHGLICMVCGATLATLKVSTIKRHIQQVHPHSLEYSPEEKLQAQLSYNQALHFVHSDDCFSSQDHGHTALGQDAGLFGT